MSYHVHKDDIALQWMDNRDVVKGMIRSLTRRVENEILRILDEEFTAAVAKGELVELLPGSDEIRNLYVQSVKSQLDYDGDVPEAIEKKDQLVLELPEAESLAI